MGPYRVIGLLGRRRDGGGVPRPRQQIESRRGAQGAPERLRIRSGPPGAIQARGSDARRPQSPHIAAIYGLEESNGRQALVLELVEGVTLAKRIEDGPLPFVDALTMARQIAEALQAALRKGHHSSRSQAGQYQGHPRRCRESARLRVGQNGCRRCAADRAFTSPTVRWRHASRRRSGDRGVHESRTGSRARRRRAHRYLGVRLRAVRDAGGPKGLRRRCGTLIPSAKILEQEPDWSVLPKSTPAAIHQLLRQCLQKDRRRRLQTIDGGACCRERLLAPRAISRRTWIAIGAAAVLAIAAGAYALSQFDRRPIASRSDWMQLTNLDSVTQPALSPDGRMLAFIRGRQHVRVAWSAVRQAAAGRRADRTDERQPAQNESGRFRRTAAASPTPSTMGARGTRGKCRLCEARPACGCATPRA